MAITFPAFLVLMGILYIRGTIIVKNYGFNGNVDTVEYDVKGTPTVKIRGREYCLGDNDWLINHQIQQGDSLIKIKGQMTFKIIKKETGKVIVIK